VFNSQTESVLSLASADYSLSPATSTSPAHQWFNLIFPQNVPIYREHLERLGLLRYSVERPMEPIRASNVQTGGRNFLEYRLTGFGNQFMRACNGPLP